MTGSKYRAISAVAAAWCLTGLLAGAALGATLSLSSRIVVFFGALGLAMGWFGFTGTYGRLNGKMTKVASPPRDVSRQRPFRVEDHIFSPEEARQYLDDFLVKQQRK